MNLLNHYFFMTFISSEMTNSSKKFSEERWFLSAAVKYYKRLYISEFNGAEWWEMDLEEMAGFYRVWLNPAITESALEKVIYR